MHSGSLETLHGTGQFEVSLVCADTGVGAETPEQSLMVSLTSRNSWPHGGNDLFGELGIIRKRLQKEKNSNINWTSTNFSHIEGLDDLT